MFLGHARACGLLGCRGAFSRGVGVPARGRLSSTYCDRLRIPGQFQAKDAFVPELGNSHEDTNCTAKSSRDAGQVMTHVADTSIPAPIYMRGQTLAGASYPMGKTHPHTLGELLQCSCSVPCSKVPRMLRGQGSSARHLDPGHLKNRAIGHRQLS